MTELLPFTSDLQEQPWPSGLTSWDGCNDAGIHLMTPWQDKGHRWKVKSWCPTAAVTWKPDWIYWLTDQTVNPEQRKWCERGRKLAVCYQRWQVRAALRSVRTLSVWNSRFRIRGGIKGQRGQTDNVSSETANNEPYFTDASLRTITSLTTDTCRWTFCVMKEKQKLTTI